jgi:hypothetical protein
MEVHEGTIKSLIRALARGDLETVERSAIALASGEKVHAEYRDEEMWPRQRLLLAWRCALPPYHRNPSRGEIVNRRTREQRLVGSFVEIVPKGSDDLDAPKIVGTIVQDDGESWLVSTKIPSAIDSSRRTVVSVRIPLDNIAICRVQVNDVQLAAFQPSRNDPSKEGEFLGLPTWEWFAANQECGLAW